MMGEVVASSSTPQMPLYNASEAQNLRLFEEAWTMARKSC